MQDMTLSRVDSKLLRIRRSFVKWNKSIVAFIPTLRSRDTEKSGTFHYLITMPA